MRKYTLTFLAGLLLAATIYPAAQSVSTGGTFNPLESYRVAGSWLFKHATAPIMFEGATDDDFETTIALTDPTADRTLTLPNATDTVVGRATTDTLTNKTVNLANNTVTGTTAGFNTANSDANFLVTGDSVIVLTNVDLDTTDNSVAAHICERQTVTATGVATTDNILWTVTSNDLNISLFIGEVVPSSADTLTVKICNNTAGALDPGAVADLRIVTVTSP